MELYVNQAELSATQILTELKWFDDYLRPMVAYNRQTSLNLHLA